MRRILLALYIFIAIGATGFGCWQISSALNHRVERWLISAEDKPGFDRISVAKIRANAVHQLVLLERVAQSEQFSNEERLDAARQHAQQEERLAKFDEENRLYEEERYKMLPAAMWEEFGIGLISFLFGLIHVAKILRAHRPCSPRLLMIMILLLGLVATGLPWHRYVQVTWSHRFGRELYTGYRDGLSHVPANLSQFCFAVALAVFCICRRHGPIRGWRLWVFTGLGVLGTALALYGFLEYLPDWPPPGSDPMLDRYSRRSGEGPLVMMIVGFLVLLTPSLTRPRNSEDLQGKTATPSR